jgi:hypothetical protein
MTAVSPHEPDYPGPEPTSSVPHPSALVTDDAGQPLPVSGFISEAEFRDKLIELRDRHRDFGYQENALSAIQDVVGDTSLNDMATVTLVRHILVGAGYPVDFR